MITTCTPFQARELLAPEAQAAGAHTAGYQALDVREYAEYAAAHVPGVRLIPLGQVRARLNEIDKARPVLVFCKGGKRAAQAAEILDQAGCTAVTVVEGGTDAWIAAGLPVATERQAPWALERQVRLAAGLLVLAGLFIPPWPWLSAFVGAGLVFAAVSNTCGMALLLARMPWNRAPAGGEACGNVGPKSCCG